MIFPSDIIYINYFNFHKLDNCTKTKNNLMNFLSILIYDEFSLNFDQPGPEILSTRPDSIFLTRPVFTRPVLSCLHDLWVVTKRIKNSRYLRENRLTCSGQDSTWPVEDFRSFQVGSKKIISGSSRNRFQVIQFRFRSYLTRSEP